MLQRGLLKQFKGSLFQLVQHQEKVPRGDALQPLGLSLWKLSKSEILIFADIGGRVPKFVCNGLPVAINGAWLQLPVPEQIQQEVSNGLYRGCPKVHLITVALLCKKWSTLPYRLIWLILFEEPQFVLPLPQRSPAP